MFKDQKLFSTLALRHMIHSGPTGTMNCFHGLKAGSYSHLKADTRVSFTAWFGGCIHFRPQCSQVLTPSCSIPQYVWPLTRFSHSTDLQCTASFKPAYQGLNHLGAPKHARYIKQDVNYRFGAWPQVILMGSFKSSSLFTFKHASTNRFFYHICTTDTFSFCLCNLERLPETDRTETIKDREWGNKHSGHWQDWTQYGITIDYKWKIHLFWSTQILVPVETSFNYVRKNTCFLVTHQH